MGPKLAYMANFDPFFGYTLLAEEHFADPYSSYNLIIYLSLIHQYNLLHLRHILSTIKDLLMMDSASVVPHIT